MQLWRCFEPVAGLFDGDMWNINEHDARQPIREYPSGENDRPAPGDVVLYGHCSSALDAAWHLVRQGDLPEGGSVLCRSQWSGRGQMRRNWISPQGNVYAAWRLPAAGPEWGNLSSLLVGYALLQALTGMGVDVRLKWPNDLLLDGSKIGGILVEERDGVLIAGVGINVAHCPPKDALRPDFAVPAGRIGTFFENVHIVPLWTELVKRAESCYKQQISRKTTREFIHLLEPFLAFLHQEVTVSGTSRTHRARVLGLHHDGGLHLQSDQEDFVLYSGSVFPVSLG